MPIQAQITLDTSGRMLFGTDIASALVTLESLQIDVLGINCSTGPEYMREPIRYLVEHSPLPISVLPNAGLPLNVDGEAVYPMEPEPFSEMVAEFHFDLVEVAVHRHEAVAVIDVQRVAVEEERAGFDHTRKGAHGEELIVARGLAVIRQGHSTYYSHTETVKPNRSHLFRRATHQF